jgi:hypothetical protein
MYLRMRHKQFIMQCCGSGMFIPDPNFFHPGSRIRIKEFKYFNPKKWFLSSRKYDLGCSSPIQIPDPDPDFLPIPDQEHCLWVRIQIGPVDPNAGLDSRSGIWIRIRESQNGEPQKKEIFCFPDYRMMFFLESYRLLLDPGNPSRSSWEN